MSDAIYATSVIATLCTGCIIEIGIICTLYM